MSTLSPKRGLIITEGTDPPDIVRAASLNFSQLDDAINDTHPALTDTRTPTDASVTDAKISGTLSQSVITNLVSDLAAKASSSSVILNTLVNAKGDLIGATANDSVAALSVGTDGQVLTVDSAEATGLKWTTAVGGGGVPDDASVTPAKFAPSAIDPGAATAGARTLGTGAQQAAAGNDARFTDARTPSALSVTDAMVSATAAIAESKLSLASDAAVGVASRRTLGTGATQAAAGNHTHTKADVGLSLVNNTSDASKPISTATQTALDAKIDVNSMAIEIIARTAISTLLTNTGKGFCRHGATAGTARPTGFASIEWSGTVEPTNAINNDTWVNA